MARLLNDIERVEATDALAEKLLLSGRYDDVAACEVWDIAAERVEKADWARLERDLAWERDYAETLD